MNYRNLLKGAAGIFAGSFIAGGIAAIVKSRRETKELCAQTEAKIKESEALIAESVKLTEDMDKMIAETDAAIAEAKRTQIAIRAIQDELGIDEADAERARFIFMTSEEPSE